MAALWVLESAQCCDRSPATFALATYVKYLGVLVPEARKRG